MAAKVFKGSVVIDIQTIRIHNVPYIKELAIHEYETDKTKVFVFLPPFPDTYLSNDTLDQIEFEELFVTGLTWNTGSLPFNHAEDILQKYQHCRIFVKGLRKKQFLEKYYEMQFVVDVEKEVPAAPRFASYTIDCFAHRDTYSMDSKCAYRNVLHLKSVLANTSLNSYLSEPKKKAEVHPFDKFEMQQQQQQQQQHRMKVTEINV